MSSHEKQAKGGAGRGEGRRTKDAHTFLRVPQKGAYSSGSIPSSRFPVKMSSIFFYIVHFSPTSQKFFIMRVACTLLW